MTFSVGGEAVVALAPPSEALASGGSSRGLRTHDDRDAAAACHCRVVCACRRFRRSIVCAPDDPPGAPAVASTLIAGSSGTMQ